MTQSLPLDADFELLNNFLPPGSIFAADAKLTISSVDQDQCAVSMTIDVLVENFGDASLPASTPIVIYDNNPNIFDSNQLGSTVL